MRAMCSIWWVVGMRGTGSSSTKTRTACRTVKSTVTSNDTSQPMIILRCSIGSISTACIGQPLVCRDCSAHACHARDDIDNQSKVNPINPETRKQNRKPANNQSTSRIKPRKAGLRVLPQAPHPPRGRAMAKKVSLGNKKNDVRLSVSATSDN